MRTRRPTNKPRTTELREQDAIAETIENNVRQKIVKEHLNDPAFYDRMSALLEEIIAARNASGRHARRSPGRTEGRR